MNYNQFMAKFKGADKTYRKKANTKNADAKTGSKVKDEMATGPISGSGTAAISKYTKQHLANVKKKNSGIKKK